ncbi:MAG: 23S rRNA pseudouridine(955/2504/2580) synthase RluC [Gammaproteobacteria bacterium]
MKQASKLGAVNKITITEHVVGQRIDNFLLKQLKGVPKSRIYRGLRQGEVRVNGGRIGPDYRLELDDVVRIPPLRVSEQHTPGKPSVTLMHLLERNILWEDDGLLILNKPSGMAVHGGSGINFGVIETLRHLRPQARFLELVHRLDRDTSGCLMIAKKSSVLREIHLLLQQHKVTKIYWALVRGKWHEGYRTVSAALLKNQLRSGERMVKVSEEGKPAVTLFKPLEYFKEATLIEATLQTGRTHQIRVHATHLGHPLAGDEKYGDKLFNKAMREVGCKRLFLHAYQLQFTLPANSQTIAVTAALPAELQKVLKHLSVQ